MYGSYYRPQTKFGNCEGYVFTGVCLSTPPPWADTPRQTSPGQTPPGQTPPSQILRDMVNKRAVRIILECILITTCKRSLGQGNKFTGVCLSTGGEYLTRYTPQDQVHPPDQVHLPGTRYSLLDQIHHPPATEHAGRYGQRAGGTHPTGMQFCYNTLDSKMRDTFLHEPWVIEVVVVYV